MRVLLLGGGLTRKSHVGQLDTGYGGGKIQSCCYFVGEMFGITIYSTELSSSQIQVMYREGRCSNMI